jgi:predicted ribosomally synthesized peptide with nif11-like leader
MNTKSIINFFVVVKEDKSLQQKVQMAADVETVVKIARECDFNFTSTELQSFLEKTPNQYLASKVNPGIGNRLHVSPR